jgi:hypothetical protein
MHHRTRHNNLYQTLWYKFLIENSSINCAGKEIIRLLVKQKGSLPYSLVLILSQINILNIAHTFLDTTYNYPSIPD